MRSKDGEKRMRYGGQILNGIVWLTIYGAACNLGAECPQSQTIHRWKQPLYRPIIHFVSGAP